MEVKINANEGMDAETESAWIKNLDNDYSDKGVSSSFFGKKNDVASADPSVSSSFFEASAFEAAPTINDSSFFSKADQAKPVAQTSGSDYGMVKDADIAEGMRSVQDFNAFKP